MKFSFGYIIFICIWSTVSAGRYGLGKIVPIVHKSDSNLPKRSPTNSLAQAVEGVLELRSGACRDSNPVLFAKIAVNAAVETCAMLGILVGTQALGETTTVTKIIPSLAGISILQWVGLFVIIFASSLIGSIVGGGISVATNQVLDPNIVPGDAGWYDKLKKPRWNPPGWLFPIMWLIVSKPTQMLALSRILKKETKLPLPILAVYCAHLALGDAWNQVFFGMQCVGRGAAVITAFFALLLTSAYAFSQVDSSAGLLLLPTCGWVLVATSLNWSIYFANK